MLTRTETHVYEQRPTGPWKRCNSELPAEGQPVLTKIDDADGCRNEQALKRQGRLWFFPDGSMYVYYTPTHWREYKEVRQA